MARWVKPPEATGTGPDREGWLTRIVKYVPTELVATFTMVVSLMSAIPGSDTTRKIVVLVFIGVFFAATYAYVAFRMPAGKPKVAQYVVSPFAFLAWAYPISAAMLGDLFNGFVAASLQAAVLLLSIFFPVEEGNAQQEAFA